MAIPRQCDHSWGCRDTYGREVVGVEQHSKPAETRRDIREVGHGYLEAAEGDAYRKSKTEMYIGHGAATPLFGRKQARTGGGPYLEVSLRAFRRDCDDAGFMPDSKEVQAALFHSNGHFARARTR